MLPALLDPETLPGSQAVMIDVLRASTTIVHALAHGAAGVMPRESVEQARETAAANPPGTVLLGGERGGERIHGFDLDNSPLAYTPEVVADKTVVFTTTNGTRALEKCAAADRIFVGCFVNRAALLRVLQADGRPVHLVCAGTDGHLTAEDILLAGCVAAGLLGIGPDDPRDLARGSVDVQTQMAIDYYLARSGDEATFRQTMRASRGGQNLIRLGHEADIERAGDRDLFDLVPEWWPDRDLISIAS
ncbi:putative 2-phosphosulfolactate phosphatase [Maioricimonas rarisocia]|uniref:Probable 2-phosphosulfolactate phosphatase n=2 Tax=Maioricimonas rarisocia TaxID=2528026 RepID=A0A517Z3M5_9PLAN|nr:putative 2-phosphosulfolactate phosphatase [Maioricimonas rarisocia]